jgi:hypothetical protein
VSTGADPGRVFREAALRAHLAGRTSAPPEAAGPGRLLVALWVVALVLVALAALAVS